MPFDAVFLTAVLEELKPAILGARVEKIQQPGADTVILTLRGKEKLLICANGSRARLHLTTAAYENPAQPPMFCMLLRKHLSGGRIAGIAQPPAERSVDLTLDCFDEMGVPCQKHLILELMGRNSNLILTGADGRILDCLRRVDFEMSQVRQVLPGLFYRPAPGQDKRIPFDLSEAEILSLLRQVSEPKRPDQWLMDQFAGLSPLVARELCYGFTGELEGDLLALDRSAFAAYLYTEFQKTERKPWLLTLDGKPKDFSYRPIYQYGSFMALSEVGSFSRMLDLFYSQRESNERLRQKSQTLRKTVNNFLERSLRKLELQRKELAATLDRERLRQLGDIVTANLHAIERGQRSLSCVDFYQEEMPLIEIPLKPDLSPQQNAARFYKDYNRAKTAEKMLTQQIAQGEIEAEYLGAVLESLSRAESERDIGEIRSELEEGGYLRCLDRRKDKKQMKQAPLKPLRFVSTEGYPIYVGRNNKQNEQLSLKTAHKNDIWLHVQKFHGAHVIIACEGEAVCDDTITEAAELAAWFSEARESRNVPVDVTAVRFLRKPKGGKPGMVIYDRYRTVFVSPEETTVNRLKEEK